MEFKLSARFLRFCCIGALGFFVDSGITYALVWAGLSSLKARIPAIIIAVTVCYFFHHGFTFKKKCGPSGKGLCKFFTTSGIGMALNYGSYALVLLAWPEIPLIVPLVVGSGVAMMANYFMAVFIVFK